MDADQDHGDLGRATAWQIKDFPERLRQRITAAAREADQTVAEYVTAAMLHHLDQIGAALPVNGFANPVNRSESRFRTAIEMACALTAHQDKMPRGMVRLATRLIKSELESMLPAGRPQFPARLPAPAAEKDPEGPSSARIHLS